MFKNGINIEKTKNKLYLIIIVVIILLMLISVGVYFLFAKNKEGNVTIISKSELVSIAKKNNLNTAKYMYSGVATKKNKKGDAVYYVNYTGIVVAGTDLDKIEINQDDKNKKVIVKIPSVTITENKVENNSLDIIFLDDKYDTEDVHADAYALSKKDLATKSNENETFIEKAQNKADSIIKALIQPLIDADGRDYELVIERSEANEK